MATTAETRTARRSHRCHGYLCPNMIQPGEEYGRFVAFPGDEVNGSNQLWVMKLCVRCATEYDQPMPPRRSKKETP